jgi:alkylation response protein AidB-like acyl-CoA dehydrogenase
MIDFSLTDEQELLVQSVRRLMDTEAPEHYLRDLDEKHAYPYGLYRHWVDAELLALPFAESIGGGGGDVLDMVMVAEEIGRKGYDLVAVYGTSVFNALNVAEHGTEQQKKELLPRFFAGDVRFAVSITEPGAGSDAGAIRTTAVRDGDEFVLNGEKMFTSGALVDDTVLSVYCQTDPQGGRKGSLSCFLVDNTTPGVEIRPVDTLGRNMYQTTQIVFDGARIPADRLLGELHGGWKVLMSALQFERITMSAAYVGNAQTVVDQALEYAKGREQFGKRIGDFQVISHLLADMQTSVDAARFLTYRAAWKLKEEGNAVSEVSMAKLFGSEAFRKVAGDGVQIMGGYGYCMETPMQRHLRAAVGSTITAGTSQMQRQTISRGMGLRPT